MRLAFIPFYLALSTLVCSQVATADEPTLTGAALQEVSSQSIIEDGESQDSDTLSSPPQSPRCMINPRGEGCGMSIARLNDKQLALGLDLSIATGGAGGLYNPEADINAMQMTAGITPPTA